MAAAIGAAEKSKDQFLRDFWGCSIFDFCNTIPLSTDIQAVLGGLILQSQPGAAIGNLPWHDPHLIQGLICPDLSIAQTRFHPAMRSRLSP